MKRVFFFSILLLMVCKLAFSTPQVRDILYWNGTTYHVYPFIDVEKRFDNEQLERLNEKAHFITTGNWRGYRYEFEIRHDSLFLVSIKNDQNEDLMAYVIGSDGRIMMDNYSDTLYLGYGKTFFDEDFPTLIYESEMTVVFENGVVTYTKDNKNKSRYSELPHNIMKLQECIYSSIRWDSLDKDILAEKPQVYVNYSIDTLGRVCDVTLRKSSGYPDFDNEAMKVIASLPEFSSYFVCGKYLEKKYRQRIVFDDSKILQNSPKSCRLINMDFFVDHYYTINYEYPSSLDELLFFCKANLSDLQSIEDSILIDYTYFKNNAEKISWIINDTLFPEQELIVLYEKDTLAYRTNEWRFPCIGFYNDAYVDCYLKEPESLECFLSFCYSCDSLEDVTNGLYDKCNKVTLKNLKKCKQLESFQWINNNDELLILIGSDTVWHHKNEALPCIDYLKPLFQPHYYDKTGQYVRLEEDVDREFRNNLRGLWYPYVNQSDAKEREYLTLVYGKTRGFYSFCKEDEIDSNIQYFKDMKEYLEKFMDNHGLSMVVFAAPAIKTVE